MIQIISDENIYMWIYLVWAHVFVLANQSQLYRSKSRAHSVLPTETDRHPGQDDYLEAVVGPWVCEREGGLPYGGGATRAPRGPRANRAERDGTTLERIIGPKANV